MRQVSCAFPLLAGIFLAACGADAPVAGTPSAAPRNGPEIFDCGALLQLSPGAALIDLTAAGYEVMWRFDHTAPSGEIISDAPRDPPDGAIGDVILTGQTAIVFVAPPGDPLHDNYPEEPTCRADG
jgi:hypothetical protein